MPSARASAILTLLCLVLAGCAQAPVEPAAEATPAPAVAVGEPMEVPGATLGPMVAPDAEATLAAPPVLRTGEWWQIRFESPLTGATADFVRVVAQVAEDGYVFGMPHEAWYKEAMVYQVPFLGEVAPNLSANVNGELFLPIRFPVVDGDTWDTQYGSFGLVTAHVEVTGPTTAHVSFTQPGATASDPLGLQGAPVTILEAVYDASVHEIVQFISPSASFEVVGHGFDYEGWVTVPRSQDMVFFVGRFAGATDLFGTPAPPTDTIDIAGGFNRLTFVLAATSSTAGAYRETATAPDGTTFEYSSVPHSGGFGSEFFEFPDPDGSWTIEHISAGVGAGFAKGIAYHQYDVLLPDGTVRGDHSHGVVR